MISEYKDQERLRLIHMVDGRVNEVSPRHQARDLQDHLGFFHTHPSYPNGEQHTVFSPGDFLATLLDESPLEVLGTGDRVSALVPTACTTPALDIIDHEVNEQWLAVFRKQQDRQDLTFDEVSMQVNIIVSQRYGLALYTGKIEDGRIMLWLEGKS